MPLKLLFIKVRQIALNAWIEPHVANTMQLAWAWTLSRLPILKPWQIITLLYILELTFLFVKIHGLDGKVGRSKCNLPLSLLHITIDTGCKKNLKVSIAQANDIMNPIHLWLCTYVYMNLHAGCKYLVTTTCIYYVLQLWSAVSR